MSTAVSYFLYFYHSRIYLSFLELLLLYRLALQFLAVIIRPVKVTTLEH